MFILAKGRNYMLNKEYALNNEISTYFSVHSWERYCLCLDSFMMIIVSRVDSVPNECTIYRWKWTVWLQTSIPSWPMQVRRLDSEEALSLGILESATWAELKRNPITSPKCQRVRTELNKIVQEWMCGWQGSPLMWAHGSWLSWCPTTSHVPVKPEVSTENGDRLPEVDQKYFQNLKWPEQIHKLYCRWDGYPS